MIIIPIYFDIGLQMYICVCNAVTEREIRRCAQLGCSLGDLRRRLGVATGCGKCKHSVKQILREERPASGECPRMQPV